MGFRRETNAIYTRETYVNKITDYTLKMHIKPFGEVLKKEEENGFMRGKQKSDDPRET